jgi:hypothetical protein
MTVDIQSLRKPMNGLHMMNDIRSALEGTEKRDLLIYLHIPFCNSNVSSATGLLTFRLET